MQAETVVERIAAVVRAARAEGRERLLESEGYRILSALGIAAPRHVVIGGAEAADDLDLEAFPGDELVVKVLSPEIAHKSEAGGVRAIAKRRAAIRETLRDMERRLEGQALHGFLVCERVVYDASLGGELLFSVRWTDDFGPIVVCGPGGIHTELLTHDLPAGRALTVATAGDLDGAGAERRLRELPVMRLLTEGLQGRAPRVERAVLVDTFLTFAELARQAVPDLIEELEVNPLVIRDGRPIALDVLARVGSGPPPEPEDRPLEKLRNLLEPRSIAIVGVSEEINPGRVMLRNTIEAGFDTARIYVVKPGSDTIDGCRCVPDVRALPEPADLCVISVAAPQVPDLLACLIEERKAESVILIPGGLGERPGSEELAARVRSVFERARRTEWRGPVINGGNCMGVRSQPGRYDATFIPRRKMRLRGDPAGRRLAIISQSGAFFAAKGSKLGIDPRYAITVGNQIDLTIGDYLTYLKDDPEVTIFAVYAEGLKRLDGLKLVAAIREITASGRTVLLYRAGRTPEGARVSASHTAVIAGDYVVTRELATEAGAVVCDTTDDFEDLLKLFTYLDGTELKGTRLGALSNAGFEVVAIADHLSGLRLAVFGETTTRRLAALLEEHGLARIVGARNPLDVTPMMGDCAYGEAVRLVLDDENVDVGLVGCVPLTSALQTLPRDAGAAEDLASPDSLATRLIDIRKGGARKPWIAVIDAGPLYDPLARRLEQHRIPTFRAADRALRLLATYCRERLRRR